ncbi:helix-turn-helix transcriptional regulator [Streptomyces collinus]|uniref:helix-turn-helix transcriptional regulator n=1 Tax=Streptomyces collinus TaxID=42684 RepID=UPI0037FB7439
MEEADQQDRAFVLLKAAAEFPHVLHKPVGGGHRGSKPSAHAPDLAPFQQAALTDRRLRLRYRHGRDNRVATYTLDPYGLVNKAGVWYLVADHDGEPRLFRTDRALSATVLDQPAQRRAGLELSDVWQGPLPAGRRNPPRLRPRRPSPSPPKISAGPSHARQQRPQPSRTPARTPDGRSCAVQPILRRGHPRNPRQRSHLLPQVASEHDHLAPDSLLADTANGKTLGSTSSLRASGGEVAACEPDQCNCGGTQE